MKRTYTNRKFFKGFFVLGNATLVSLLLVKFIAKYVAQIRVLNGNNINYYFSLFSV
jgi:hypothetical protein